MSPESTGRKFNLRIAIAIVVILLAVVLIAREMKRPSYHGVGWRNINPDLPKWWKSRVNGKV